MKYKKLKTKIFPMLLNFVTYLLLLVVQFTLLKVRHVYTTIKDETFVSEQNFGEVDCQNFHLNTNKLPSNQNIKRLSLS